MQRRSRDAWWLPAFFGAAASSCGQAPPAAGPAVPAAYSAPRTAWGDPDLQGMWPIDKLNGTPVQRPESFGDRRFLTDEEFAERVERLRGLNARYDEEIATNKMGIGHWAEMGQPNRLTSLIVEPANGRVPPLTAEGERRSATMTSSWSDIPFDKVSDFNPLDRCITRGLPASMFPFMYNSGIEILQAPGYVVIRLEIVHETRVIPVDGAAALAPEIRQWLGESRGRFEGDTLVDRDDELQRRIADADRRARRQADPDEPRAARSSSGSRASATTRSTTRSPSRIPSCSRSRGRPRSRSSATTTTAFFEYACHEDNSAIRNFIVTSRFERRQRAGERRHRDRRNHRSRRRDDRALARLEKALGRSVGAQRSGGIQLDDQRQRLKALGDGREETMRALTEARDELRAHERGTRRAAQAPRARRQHADGDDRAARGRSPSQPAADGRRCRRSMTSWRRSANEECARPTAASRRAPAPARAAPADADDSEEMIAPRLVFPEQYADTAKTGEHATAAAVDARARAARPASGRSSTRSTKKT